jgi:hypothetical protein
MESRIVLGAMVAVMGALSAPGSLQAAGPIAEVLCEPRSRLIARLAAIGADRPAGQGLRDPDTVLEIWVTPHGRWTLVQSHAGGTACILAMGEGWEAAPAPAVAAGPLRDPA